jgi:hypothetical protein
MKTTGSCERLFGDMDGDAWLLVAFADQRREHFADLV